MAEPEPKTPPPLKAPRASRYWGTDCGQQFLTAKAARDLDELAFAFRSRDRAWIVERALGDLLNKVCGE